MEANAVHGQVVLTLDDLQGSFVSQLQTPVLAALVASTVACLGSMGAGILGPAEGVPLAVTTAGLALVAIFAPRRIAQRILEGKSPGELDTTYVFDDRGFILTSAVSEFRSAWSQVKYYRETKTAFLLSSGAGGECVVPKRAFQDGEIPRLRALFQQHLQAPPRWRPSIRHLAIWVVLVMMMIVYWSVLKSRQ